MSDELDDLFHWAAFVAYIDEARAAQTWPDSKKVQRRAYEIYETELRRSNDDQVAKK